MDSAVTLSWLEMQQLSNARARADHDSRMALLARENARLEQENERLLARNVDLAASAETWIHLYETALARANAAGYRALERTTAFSPETSSGAAVSADTGDASAVGAGSPARVICALGCRSGFGGRAG